MSDECIFLLPSKPSTDSFLFAPTQQKVETVFALFEAGTLSPKPGAWSIIFAQEICVRLMQNIAGSHLKSINLHFPLKLPILLCSFLLRQQGISVPKPREKT